MTTDFSRKVKKMEIFHKAYSLNGKDNLATLPSAPAVFGLFASINNTPVHPRLIAATDNLQTSIINIFEHPESTGIRKFMQGPIVKILCFELVKNLDQIERARLEETWVAHYEPKVTDDGEYPDYKYRYPEEDVATSS